MKRFWVACCLLLVFAQPVCAADWAVQEVKSKSGITAWLVEDEKLPLIALKFAWRGGVEQDPAERQGLSHLAADMLTEGAGPYDADAFQQRVSDSSIHIGFTAGRDSFGGSVKTLRETRAIAFRLLRLALLAPRLDAEAFQRAKERQNAAIRETMGSAEWQMRFAFFDSLFPGHPYANRSLGSLESLEKITSEDLRGFIQGHLARDNLVISVAGAIDAKELAIVLDQVFGDLPEKAKISPVSELVFPVARPVIGVLRDGTQTDVLFALPGPKRDDPDWYAAEIANYILGGGGFSSRLMKKVRDDEGLTYGIGTGLGPMDHGGLIMGTMATDNAKTRKAIDLVISVWQAFFASGPTEAELSAAKEYLVGAGPLSLTSTDRIAAFLLQCEWDHLGHDYLTRRVDFIRGVTVNDIRRVLDRYFDPDRLVFSMVGRPEDVTFTHERPLIKE